MIDVAGFEDLRRYIKRRVSYARYRVGTTYHQIYLSKVQILANGTVRVQLNINSNGAAMTVNRVELYNTDGQLWAYQDCKIELEAAQTGILFWFEFTLREEVSTNV